MEQEETAELTWLMHRWDGVQPGRKRSLKRRCYRHKRCRGPYLAVHHCDRTLLTITANWLQSGERRGGSSSRLSLCSSDLDSDTILLHAMQGWVSSNGNIVMMRVQYSTLNPIHSGSEYLHSPVDPGNELQCTLRTASLDNRPKDDALPHSSRSNSRIRWRLQTRRSYGSGR